MARAVRIALDLTLLSLSKVRPAVSILWTSTKTAISKTQAKVLVCNPVVDKTEVAMTKLTDTVVSFLSKIRDNQLPNELRYLEKEIEKIKKRIGDSEASKAMKPAISTTWKYAKTEIVPPMTVNFFNGTVGKNIKDAVAKAGDSFIAIVQKQIHQIDIEEARQIKQKEAEAKAAREKIKAEAKRKTEVAKKKEEEKLANEAKARQQAEAEKKAEADKKAADAAEKAGKDAKSTKTAATAICAKASKVATKARKGAKAPEDAAKAKKAAKKGVSQKKARQDPKKHRRKAKKGSPPKSKK